MADRHPMPTSINWSEGFEQVPSYINDVSKGWFGTMMIISVYIITLMGVLFYKGDGEITDAFMIAGVFTSIVAILFWIGGFINGWVLTFTIVVGIAGVVAWIKDK